MHEQLKRVVQEIGKAIAGKQEIIEKVLMALLADGHILLDDVPGVGKTTLALALCHATELNFRRMQFTPDVMPSDLTGFSMYNKNTGVFDFCPGALQYTNLLLGDEINRTTSKTQSALLEAMEERKVTVDGNTYLLEKPFLVIATQNSVGTAGTQLLPYAQMDRFLVRLSLGYPDYDAMMDILRDRQDKEPLDQVEPVLSKEQLLAMQKEVRSVNSGEAILDYITRLMIASHKHESIEIGISPRGAIHMDRMAKARAYLYGRDYVTGADVQAIFHDVCAHRILLKEAAADRSADTVLNDIIKQVENPDRRSRMAGLLKR